MILGADLSRQVIKYFLYCIHAIEMIKFRPKAVVDLEAMEGLEKSSRAKWDNPPPMD
jgi:hypothetical protein